MSEVKLYVVDTICLKSSPTGEHTSGQKCVVECSDYTAIQLENSELKNMVKDLTECLKIYADREHWQIEYRAGKPPKNHFKYDTNPMGPASDVLCPFRHYQKKTGDNK